MKLSLLVTCLATLAQASGSLKFRIYDNNIRNGQDDLEEGEHVWDERKVQSINSMKFNTQHNKGIITLQEVLKRQIDDITEALGDEWVQFGVGREDGKDGGEFNPIYYKKSDWELVKNHTWWLSETPNKPSKSWDAAFNRIVEFVQLKDTDTGKEVGVFNTHFDHKSEEARKNSAELILKLIDENLDKDVPFTLSGDFNSEPDAAAYKTMAGKLTDVATLFEGDKRYGYTNTSTTFVDSPENESIIDFMWIPGGDKIKATSFGVLESDLGGFLFSDHRPIAGDFEVA